MSDPRADILAAVRRAVADQPGADSNACARRLAEPKPNLVPERGRGSGPDLVTRFVAEAETASATIAHIPSLETVPDAVAAYVEAENLPRNIRSAPALNIVPWSKQPAISTEFGTATAADPVGISLACAGIAETGTLMVVSGPDTPAGLNFLPDNHLVVLDSAAVVGAYEDAWAAFRTECGGTAKMPRAVNWITGPSRSADIELVLLLGVHGPRRLHILLVDGQDA